nr:MAG TPA: hypothetical protein [Caudoviricetes sp.]
MFPLIIANTFSTSQSIFQYNTIFVSVFSICQVCVLYLRMKRELLLVSNNSLELFSLSLERELLVSVSVSVRVSLGLLGFHFNPLGFFGFLLGGLPPFAPFSLFLLMIFSSYF